MSKTKKNRVGGLLSILVFSFLLISSLWNSAGAVSVTINGYDPTSTTGHKLDVNGLIIDDTDGGITVNVAKGDDSGEISGYVDIPGSKIYLRRIGIENGIAKYVTDPTDANLPYSFKNLPDGDYLVFPVYMGMKFTPESIPVTLNATTGRTKQNANFAGGPAVPVTYAVYGNISGSTGSVTLSVSGGKTQTITAPGSYIFNGLVPGNYTITASSTALNVSPQSTPVNIVNSDMKADFNATPKTYTISGYVKDAANTAISGAAISINAGTCSSSDSTGYYSCNNMANGTYTLNASKSGYSITPAPLYVTITDAPKAQQNFTAATATTYTISGTVTGLAAGANATISLTGSATKSTSTVNGAYSLPGLLAGNYTVTPSLSGYTFTPANSGNLSVASDITRNFTATSNTLPPTPPYTTLVSGKEVVEYDLAVGATKLYKADVLVPSIASFGNATKDWSTQRDMLVMYGGASCSEPVPTIADHTAIKAGISNGSLTTKSDTGTTVNGRTFYYNFQDVNNQTVIIGRLWQPPAPAGCYWVLIYNVSSSPADYSTTFIATPK